MHVCITNHTILTHITLAFFRFFGQDVTFKSFLKHDLTGTGNFKALLGAAVGFNLWHYITVLVTPCWRFRNYGTLDRALWEMSEKESFLFRAAKIRGNWENWRGLGKFFGTGISSLILHCCVALLYGIPVLNC